MDNINKSNVKEPRTKKGSDYLRVCESNLKSVDEFL